MFKNLLSLACINKKEKKRLAIAAGSSETSSSAKKNSSRESGNSGPDDTLDKSIAIQTSDVPFVINTSQFLTGVLGDVSLNTANLQNRETPIDFGTREVKDDGDVMSVTSRRPSSLAITPSPIPEETEDNYSIDQFETPAQRDQVLAAFKLRTPRPGKPRKLAKVYRSEISPSASSSSNNEESYRVDSMRARTSKSAIQQMYKGRVTPVLGGSLRPLRGRRHSVIMDGETKFYSLDRHNSDGKCFEGAPLIVQ